MAAVDGTKNGQQTTNNNFTHSLHIFLP